MNHNTLENYYKTMFSLVHHHKYSIADIESMIGFELNLYISMINDSNAKEKEHLDQLRAAEEAKRTRKRF